jgi:hypothetical protein
MLMHETIPNRHLLVRKFEGPDCGDEILQEYVFIEETTARHPSRTV